ncbi:MAG: PspA/IM30 family protein [Pseudomonadota bacterium]
MWKTVSAIFLGRAARAEERLENDNAALIIEQKVREATAGQDAAKRALASLIARSNADRKALEGVERRIADLETRTRAALEAGKTTLAQDAAKLLADLENERAVRQRTLAGAEEKADRLRLALEKTERQLVDLRQGLITAKAIERERVAMRNIKGDISANAAVREGEDVLKRLLESEDPIAEIDALDEVEAQLSGDAVIDRLADAGFGDARKVRAEDVLARLSGENTTADASA